MKRMKELTENGFKTKAPPGLGFGHCARCGHGQRITPLQLELPAAVRCDECGGPIEVPLLGTKDDQPKPWRCCGCGGMFDPKHLHWSISLHLQQSPDCGAVLLEKDRFIRHGLTFILPESAHIKRIDKTYFLLAANCKGAPITLGRWKNSDKQFAKEALRKINPASPQLPKKTARIKPCPERA